MASLPSAGLVTVKQSQKVLPSPQWCGRCSSSPLSTEVKSAGSMTVLPPSALWENQMLCPAWVAGWSVLSKRSKRASGWAGSGRSMCGLSWR